MAQKKVKGWWLPWILTKSDLGKQLPFILNEHMCRTVTLVAVRSMMWATWVRLNCMRMSSGMTAEIASSWPIWIPNAETNEKDEENGTQ